MQSGITQIAKEEREHFHFLADMLPQLVWIGRPDGTIEYRNQRWYEYTNTTPESYTDQSPFQFYHPDDQARLQKLWQTSLQTGQLCEAEYRLLNGKTGEYHWFLVRALPQKDAQERVIKWFVTSTDIDRQKQTEEALLQKIDELRLLADTMPQLIWIMRADGSEEYTNQRWQDYTNIRGDQLLGNKWLQLIHPDDRKQALTAWNASCTSGRPYEAEYRFLNGKTGEYHWFMSRALPLTDAQGHVIKWFGTSTDIDEKKRLEETLRKSETCFRKLFASKFIGVVIGDMEGHILDVNDTFLQLTGYSRQELVAEKLHWSQMTSGDLYESDIVAAQQLRATDSVPDSERELIRKDGSHIWVLIGTATFDPFTNTIITFAVDINERKILEPRKDEFISLASHELKSPLASLKLIAQYLGRKLKKGQVQEAEKYLAQITTQIDDCTRLVNDLLDLSKIRSSNLTYKEEPFRLDTFIQEVVANEQKKESQHQLLLQETTEISFVGDKQRIGQVLVNLISNAIKCSPLTDKVEIHVTSSQDTITISIHDYGPGIAKEHQDKIFECFYRVASKKESGVAGLGIGLYLSSNIVQHYGGKITVESSVGKGSTFIISLPISLPVT